jgi:hypothetical protein
VSDSPAVRQSAVDDTAMKIEIQSLPGQLTGRKGSAGCPALSYQGHSIPHQSLQLVEDLKTRRTVDQVVLAVVQDTSSLQHSPFGALTLSFGVERPIKYDRMHEGDRESIIQLR